MFRRQLLRLAFQQVVRKPLFIGRFYPSPIYRFSTHAERYDFKAETKKLLDIVAKSIYTDKDVFLRELLSNASDALEKQRFLSSQNPDAPEEQLQIKINLDEERRIISLEDSGVGMTRQELIDNLGTIARSGSRSFVSDKGADAIADKIIGQFGVGFYSSFIVGDTVEVTSRSTADSVAHVWTSDGTGTFEIAESEELDFPRGTRIRIFLKPDQAIFVKRSEVEKTIQRYSNFIGFPMLINNEPLDLVQAIWSRSKNEVSSEEHQKFFEYITSSKNSFRYKLHYTTDAPMSIKALLYIPNTHSEKLGMQMEQFDVSLYSRKILIKKQCRELLPNYLRFVKGVVDCEDIPLNISRESYQDSALLAKLRSTITKRILRELDSEANKDPVTYLEWYNDFQFFLKEGVAQDTDQAEPLMKLLRFQSNKDDKYIGLDDYINIAPKEQKTIYFLSAPQREHALHSPYLEPFKGTDIPVLFSYVHIDEMVFKNINEYKGYKFVNIESQQNELKDIIKEVQHDALKGLPVDEIAPFSLWLKNELQPSITQVEVSKRLKTAPAIVTSPISSGVRQVLTMLDKNQAQQLTSNLTLEINPNHKLIIELNQARKVNMKVASLIAKCFLDNCLITSGLVQDSQSIVNRNISLIELALQNTMNTPQVETPQETKREKKQKDSEEVEVFYDQEGKPSVRPKQK